MRINGTNGPSGPTRNGARQRREKAGGVFRLDESRPQGKTTATHGPAAISGVEALIALQSLGGDRPAGARLRHGHDLLDLLEDIKIGLLGGRLSTAKLERLVDSLQRRPPRLAGEAVEDVLDEIELRARVELAKLGREAA